jgi:hypothetical protein
MTMSENQTEFRQQFVTSFVAFMKDCNFHYGLSRSHSNILCALAYCYRPSAHYWEQLTTALVVEALETYMPTQSSDQADNVAFLHQRIADHLYMRQHDEKNALLLATLKPKKRPRNAEDAADWICAKLERMGDQEHLEYAERDGATCGEAALLHLAVIEANDNRMLDLHADFACFLLAQAKSPEIRYGMHKAEKVSGTIFQNT